jgi:GntR family transcriptional repressor for pyruvate dehydrogenase complex
MRLKPAQRVSLSQVVLDQLLEQIRNGRLRPGDRLPGEYELMDMLKVGRSSVREALRGLVVLGLVETKPRRGAVVCSKDFNPLAHLRSGESIEKLKKWALLDLLEVRECLEGKAAQLAAERATPADLVAISRHAQEVEKEILEGKSYFRPNARFHLAIARASHNSTLAESIQHVIGRVRDYRERMIREMTGMPQRDLEEHASILQAIKERTPDRARRAMVTHIKHFVRVVSQHEAVSGGEVPIKEGT